MFYRTLKAAAALLLTTALCCQGDCTNPPPTQTDVIYTCSVPGTTAVGGTCSWTCAAGSQAVNFGGSVLNKCRLVSTSYASWTAGDYATCIPLPCPNPPTSVTSVTWDVSCTVIGGSTSSGSTCPGTCASGTSAVNGGPSASCNRGIWTLGAGRCQIAAVPTPCVTLPDSTLVSGAAWNCSPTASGATCTGSCATGTAEPVSGPPVAACTNGQWSYFSGACTACLTSQLPSLTNSNTFSWPNNCTSSASAATNTVCVGACKAGYNFSATGAPKTTCSNGTWQAVTGGCQPLICTGNPSPEIVLNATWNCPATTQFMQNCTGDCSDTVGSAGPPVAVCESLGQWAYAGGSCTGGGKIRYFTVTGPSAQLAELFNAIIGLINDGTVYRLIKRAIDDLRTTVRQSLLPLFPQASDLSTTQLVNLWIASANQGNITLGNRKLLTTDQDSVTVGFQLADGTGMFSFAQEQVIDLLLAKPTVVASAVQWAVGVAMNQELLPPTTNFSGVAAGMSDSNGQFVGTPITSDGPACFLIFQTNYSLAQTNTSAAATALCPGTTVISAEFPYVSSSIVNSASFSAVATNSAGDGGADPNITCTVLPGGTGSSPTARVNCTRNDGSPYPPNSLYSVALTTTFSCSGGPNARAYASANFAVKAGPSVTIKQQGPAKPMVCSDALVASVDYNFTVTADASAGQIALAALQQQQLAAAAGTNCLAKILPGPQTTVGNMSVVTGTATVTCQGPFSKPPSALNLNLTLTASLEGCGTTTKTAKTRVSVVCCKKGSSYARQQRVGTKHAVCFNHYPPGTTSKDCGNSSAVFGLYNKGPATAKLSFFDGNTTKCVTRASVGTAVMSCDSGNTKLVNFKLQSSNRDLAADQQFLLSCVPPSIKAGACPGTLQWQDVGLKGANATVMLAGRTKVTTFSAALPAGASCDCQDAVWAVYESGVYTGLPAKQCR